MVEKYIELADLCVKTYIQFNRDDKFTVPKKYKKIASFYAEALGVQEWFGFILENDEEIIIAFRGTNSNIDWIADALAFHKEFPYFENCGTVHHGFLQIYNSCRERIMKELMDLDNRKNIIVTGHSLGAALATICTLDLAKNTEFNNIELINFASPRVGNRKFCKQVNNEVKSIVRIINVHDIVTLLPPIAIPLPCNKNKGIFRHVKGKYKLDVQKETIFGNHNIGTYIHALKKIKKTT